MASFYKLTRQTKLFRKDVSKYNISKIVNACRASDLALRYSSTYLLGVNHVYSSLVTFALEDTRSIYSKGKTIE